MLIIVLLDVMRHALATAARGITYDTSNNAVICWCDSNFLHVWVLVEVSLGMWPPCIHVRSRGPVKDRQR
jgi:hypothetical protein